MALILGALGGAGAQLADFADKGIAQQDKLDALTMESSLQQQRAQALEQFKADLETRQRQAMVDRVQGAAGNIADQQMAPTLAQEQAGIADPASWTPEQQAAMDQSNALTRQGIVNRALQDGSAGIATGDIAPKDAMGNTSKLEINQIKMDNLLARASDRNATQQEIAQIRSDAVLAAAQLRVDAAQQRATNGKIDNATGRMLITSEDANIKASTNQMQMLQREKENTRSTVNGKPNPRLAEIDQQIAGLRDDIDTSKKNKSAYLRSMNIVGAESPSTPAAAPAPAASAAPAPAAAPAAAPSTPAAPPGGKLIGTSKGRPVYQLPDGSKVVAQ